MNIVKQLLKESVDFFYQIFVNRELLFTLSLREFRQKYVLNFFGFIWAILDPLAFVVILYFVFGARYADKGPNGISFMLYLITGYVVFDFFSSTTMAVTN